MTRFKNSNAFGKGVISNTRNENAFTLAEVLITLGIIGIVAALTLPVLINNINGQKYRSQFKKSFSTLTQAAKTAQQAYEMSFAGINESCLEDGSDAPTRHSMCGMLNGALSGATYLGPAGDIYGCGNISIGDYDISYYNVYRLSDGSYVGFNRNMANCSVPTGTILTENVLTGSGALKSCLGFIDVNGDHNPNTIVAGVSADSVSWFENMAFGYGAGYGDENSWTPPQDTHSEIVYNPNMYIYCRVLGNSYECYSKKNNRYDYVSQSDYQKYSNPNVIFSDGNGGYVLNSNTSSSSLPSEVLSNGICAYPSWDKGAMLRYCVSSPETFNIRNNVIGNNAACLGEDQCTCRGSGCMKLDNLNLGSSFNSWGFNGYVCTNSDCELGCWSDACAIYDNGQIKAVSYNEAPPLDSPNSVGYSPSGGYIYNPTSGMSAVTGYTGTGYTGTGYTGTGNYTYVDSCSCLGDRICPCTDSGSGGYILKPGVTMRDYNAYMGYNEAGYAGAGYDVNDSCSATSFDPSAACKVENRRDQISDIFPIVFHDGVVEPASGAAKAVLHQTK